MDRFPSYIMRQDHWRNRLGRNSGFLKFTPKPFEVIQGHLAMRHGSGPCSRGVSSLLTEHHDVEERIPHEAICAVKSAGSFSGHKEAFDGRLGIDIDLDPAVLIMKRRIG